MEKELMVLEVIREEVVLGKQFKIYGSWDNPLFLAKDVAEMIDYAKTGKGAYDVSKMLKTVDEEEKTIRTIFVSGQNRDVSMLTEDGLYEVLMQSRKPIAKEAKKKVKTILKQMRLTGASFVKGREQEVVKTYFPKFSDSTKLAMVEELIESNDKYKLEIEEKNAVINKMSPVYAFVNMVSYTSENNVQLKNFADALGIKGLGRNSLYKLLRDMKVITKGSTLPYRKYIDSEHLTVVQELGRNGKVCYTTYVTQKGQEYLTKKILKELDKHFIHISDEAKDYARQFIHIVGKSEEEYFAMLVKPESFRDEWEGVARFIRETTDEEEYEEDNDYDIADEIDEMLSEIE